MKYLSNEQIIILHRALIQESGGSIEIRDMGLLESAVSAPFQTFEGRELYPSVYVKAAHLAYGTC